MDHLGPMRSETGQEMGAASQEPAVVANAEAVLTGRARHREHLRSCLTLVRLRSAFRSCRPCVCHLPRGRTLATEAAPWLVKQREPRGDWLAAVLPRCRLLADRETHHWHRFGCPVAPEAPCVKVNL